MNFDGIAYVQFKEICPARSICVNSCNCLLGKWDKGSINRNPYVPIFSTGIDMYICNPRQFETKACTE
jgi:hypothetical protein